VHDNPLVLAYLGPETFVPLVSVLAGAIGVVLAFGTSLWRISAAATRRLLRPFVRKRGVRAARAAESNLEPPGEVSASEDLSPSDVAACSREPHGARAR